MIIKIDISVGIEPFAFISLIIIECVVNCYLFFIHTGYSSQVCVWKIVYCIVSLVLYNAKRTGTIIKILKDSTPRCVILGSQY